MSRKGKAQNLRSVLPLPISLGAVQKLIDRTSQAIMPHYEAIATLARQATVGYIDETPWYCRNALHWLWTLTTDTVSLSLIHPNRWKNWLPSYPCRVPTLSAIPAVWHHIASSEQRLSRQHASRVRAAMKRRREPRIGTGPGYWDGCLTWRWAPVPFAAVAHCTSLPPSPKRR